MIVGAVCAWHGDAVRVDGRQNVLRLDGADGSEVMRRKAARMVHRLVGAAMDHKPVIRPVAEDLGAILDSSFVVTDGAKTYTVTMIDVAHAARPLLMFLGVVTARVCWAGCPRLNAVPMHMVLMRGVI